VEGGSEPAGDSNSRNADYSAVQNLLSSCLMFYGRKS
jgi:hypothetical protein